MPVYKAEAIVLRRRMLGEADRVITFLTLEHGKLSAAARAVRKTTSRLAGGLEPFAHVRLLLAHGRTLDVVAQVEVIDGMTPLRADLSRFGQAAVLAELVDAAVPEREPHPALFWLLRDALSAMTGAEPEVVTLWGALHLISLAGFQPVLDACAVCGRSLVPGAAWSHPLGGLVCPRCAARDPAAARLRRAEIVLLGAVRDARSAALESLAVPPLARARLLDLLRRYAEHRLEVRLRSPGVVQQWAR